MQDRMSECLRSSGMQFPLALSELSNASVNEIFPTEKCL